MKPMKQLSVAETRFLPKAGKQTLKVVFLAEMETVVPWLRLEALIEPFYPKKGNGRPSMPLGTMLRIHFMEQWFGYSDPAMEEALHDVPLLRRFAGLDSFEEVMPDASTILRFRHLLEKHELTVAIFAEVNAVLSEKGLSMKRGALVDATLIAAPSSTKNEDKKRDPEMTQTKKGNRWHFGMKAHIGVDADSGLIHPVECMTAKVADIAMMEKWLHGEETIALGDRDYHKENGMIDEFQKEGNLAVLTPTKKATGGALTEEQKACNRMLSSVRAIVEYPFRLVKRQFGLVKVRYRGPGKEYLADCEAVCAGQFVDGSQAIIAFGGRGALVKQEIWGPLNFTVNARKFACFHHFMMACQKMAGCSENPKLLAYLQRVRILHA